MPPGDDVAAFTASCDAGEPVQAAWIHANAVTGNSLTGSTYDRRRGATLT